MLAQPAKEMLNIKHSFVTISVCAKSKGVIIGEIAKIQFLSEFSLLQDQQETAPRQMTDDVRASAATITGTCLSTNLSHRNIPKYSVGSYLSVVKPNVFGRIEQGSLVVSSISRYNWMSTLGWELITISAKYINKLLRSN